METANPVIHQVHLARLRSFQQGLIGALGEAGVGGVRLGDLLASHVSVECVQCGIRLTGAEIAEALALGPEVASPNSKQGRLVSESCARQGCASYFYRYAFQPAEGLDWNQVLTRATEWTEAASARPEPPDASSSLVRFAVSAIPWRRVLPLAALLLILVGYRVGRHWWYTGALPGLSVKPKYQVDPASLPKPPLPKPTHLPPSR